jgi:hypothetical protein
MVGGKRKGIIHLSLKRRKGLTWILEGGKKILSKPTDGLQSCPESYLTKLFL